MKTTISIPISLFLWSAALPALAVPASLTAKYRENRAARVVPRYSSPERSLDESIEASVAEGELLRADDGVLVMAFDVTPEMRARLAERATPQVTRVEELRDGVLYQGRWIRVLHAAPDVAGLEADSMERMVGRRVRATLRVSLTGRHLVVAVQEL